MIQEFFTASSDAKLKKEQYICDIRRTHRNNILDKRRYQVKMSPENKSTSTTFIEKHDNNPTKVAEALQMLYVDLTSNEKFNIYTSLIALRKISEDDPNFLKFSYDRENFIVKFIDYSYLQDNYEIQIEAVKVLTNLSLAEESIAIQIIEKNFMSLVLTGLSSFKADLQEMLLLALGNLVGESVLLRNAALDMGILDILIGHIEKVASKNGVWALCNLVRGHPAPDSLYYTKAFPIIMKRACRANSISNIEEAESSEDCLWTLVELSDLPLENINVINFFFTEDTYLRRITDLLELPTMKIIVPVLRILTNILSNDTKLTYVTNLIVQFQRLFEHSSLQIRLETCTLLSTIVSAHSNLSEMLIENGIVSKLLYLIRTDHKSIVKECCWIINKLSKNNNQDELMALCKLGVLEAICDLLTDSDVKILLICLEIVERFLINGEIINSNTASENFYAVKLQSISAIKKIEDLQDSPNENVYAKSLHILETYFLTEEI
jgi:hypothetical protein